MDHDLADTASVSANQLTTTDGVSHSPIVERLGYFETLSPLAGD